MSALASIDEMSVKELKKLIADAGLSSVGLAEKSELRERAREARARLAEKPTAPPRTTTEDHPWAPKYEYINGSEPELAVVMMHGIGASKEDLVPLAERLQLNVATVFIFPGAPNGQWWPLDAAEWMQSIGSQEKLAKLIRTEFPGLAQCRRDGADLVHQIRSRFPKAKLVLGGFSQGAMTSTDIALHLATPCDAILHLSGAPIDVEVWATKLKTMTKKPLVYISHGNQDFVLPPTVATWTKTLFEQASCDVTFRPHDGLHDVGPLDPIAGFLMKTLLMSS